MGFFNDSNLGKNILIKRLKEQCDADGDVQTLALVEQVAEFAFMRLRTVIKNMPEFTLHDEIHISNMLTILVKIIPVTTIEKLSVPDLLMLVLSVFLHDIGMAPEEKFIRVWKGELQEYEYDDDLRKERESFSRFRMTFTHQIEDIEKLRAQKELGRAQALEGYIITEYIRMTHAIRARKIISDFWADRIIYKDTVLSEDLASICFSHSEDYLYLLNMETFKLCGQDTYLCLPFVAAMLRLADIIDFDPKRTPLVLFSHLAVKNPVSLKEWKKHMSINAWSISPKKLVFSAQCEHPAIEAAILSFCDEIDNELRNGTVVLSNLSDEGMDVDVSIYKIPLPARTDRRKIGAKRDIITGNPIYRYHDTKFSLSKKQIIDLLMGTKLYGKPEVALRELFQNSIDACLLRQRLSEAWGVEYTPKILVSLYSKSGVDYLQVKDNGIGMNQHIIDNYYTNIGCSYYSSREFNDLMSSIKSSFTPISKFGIGILSCFMVCDTMEVDTRRIKDRFECDDALHICIEGYESLFIISDSDQKEPGTNTVLTLRKVHPWEKMSENDFINCIRNIVPNPAVPIEIKTTNSHEYHSSEYFDDLTLEPLYEYTWQHKKNVRKIDIDLDCDEYSFKGKGTVAIIVKGNGNPTDKIDILSKDVKIDGEVYTLSSDVTYGENSINENTTNLSVDEEGVINSATSYYQRFQSRNLISIHGIEVPCKVFSDFSSRYSKTVLHLPFPILFRLDIGQKGDLNLNSARDQIIYDDKWLTFEENFYTTLCRNLSSALTSSEWQCLLQISQNGKYEVFCRIAQIF